MNFDHLKLTVDKKAEVAHQAMMKQLVDAGFVTQDDKRWLGKWGKLLKQNAPLGFFPDHLTAIISKGIKLEREGKANARGFVRNRLQNADWRKWL